MNAEVKSKDIHKKLLKTQNKLADYEKREASMLSLRRAVNTAEFRTAELEQEMASLKVERERAVERFVTINEC